MVCDGHVANAADGHCVPAANGFNNTYLVISLAALVEGTAFPLSCISQSISKKTVGPAKDAS
jgi:hypothetical protein